jgi:hypothetical protein
MQPLVGKNVSQLSTTSPVKRSVSGLNCGEQLTVRIRRNCSMTNPGTRCVSSAGGSHEPNAGGLGGQRQYCVSYV